MWVMASGVWEMPGPACPSTDPASTRTSAPPSSEVSMVRSWPWRSWYCGAMSLLRPGQVDPQLQAVEQATGLDQRRGRGLDVQEAVTRGHVLRAAVVDGAATAMRVLVDELAVDEVGERLEAAVRVPGRALRLAGRVLDLAHLVHVDERVEDLHRHPGEGTMHRESLALESGGRRGDRRDRSRGGLRHRGQAGQGQGVSGDGGHGFLLGFIYSTLQLPTPPAHSRAAPGRPSVLRGADAMKALDLELNSSQSTRRSTPMASAACTR